MKQARSGLQMGNLQEVLDAEQSAEWATLGYQQQYETPIDLARSLWNKLNEFTPRPAYETAFDPQCASGNLVSGVLHYGITRYGCDIDRREFKDSTVTNRMTGNCVKIMDTLLETQVAMDKAGTPDSPKKLFSTCNANPPFGKRWTLADGSVVDSTEHTWNMVHKLGTRGIFIANAKTIKRLGYDKHPSVLYYEEITDVWPECAVVIGCIIWSDIIPGKSFYDQATMDPGTIWNKAAIIHQEEMGGVPEFNVWIDKRGRLDTYLSTRQEMVRKISRADVLRLSRVKGQYPITLTTERETRELLSELASCGAYKISAEACKAIDHALADVAKHSCPIMPVTDFELIAYADEEDELLCIKDGPEHTFKAGESYGVKTSSYKYTDKFVRKKICFDEMTGETYTDEHNCTLSGQDRKITLHKLHAGYGYHGTGSVVACFKSKLDQWDKEENGTFSDERIWEFFQKPPVQTVAERFADKVESNRNALRMCEMMSGFTYYPGQIDYLSRVAVKDYGLIAADTGCGKTLMAISLIALKTPKRALIVAPQGTMRSSEEDEDEEQSEGQTASQWVQEIRRFAPYLEVYEIFSREDYQRIINANGGELPLGVYVSYFEAMFQNGGKESSGATWNDDRFAKECTKLLEIKCEVTKPDDEVSVVGSDKQMVSTIGEERNGIRCIMKPCLSSEIGHLFDMVCIDEAHKMCNMDANLSQMAIRLTPKFRFAFTATPIPNTIKNLFLPMGWLCVENWYVGNVCNASFPYQRNQMDLFETTFSSVERDLTQEKKNTDKNKDWKGKCEKVSPILSSPARLLKILKPSMSFISKPMCNPDYKPPEVLDVRVPMGAQQTKLYGHYLDRGNIAAKHPLVRARKQLSHLRYICADPAGFQYPGPSVSTSFNPKMVAILELIVKIMKEREQVVIVCARKGQTSAIEKLLLSCGIKTARIDSTIQPSEHAKQANMFKSGDARVMMMGIKCAVGYSFPECPYEIIGSLEYSYGSLHQAKGRVDRVNSKKPRKIYCVLNEKTIEEVMFDLVATKQDSANICLHGQRVPRDFKPMDSSEVMASAYDAFVMNGGVDESRCLDLWPKLRDELTAAAKL